MTTSIIRENYKFGFSLGVSDNFDKMENASVLMLENKNEIKFKKEVLSEIDKIENAQLIVKSIFSSELKETFKKINYVDLSCDETIINKYNKSMSYKFIVNSLIQDSWNEINKQYKIKYKQAFGRMNIINSQIVDLNKINNLTILNDLKISTNLKLSKTLIRRVESVINELRIQPELIPTKRKSVLFKFDSIDEKSLCFEIFSFKYDYVIAPIKSLQNEFKHYITEENLKFDINNIKKIIGEFYGEEIRGFIGSK